MVTWTQTKMKYFRTSEIAFYFYFHSLDTNGSGHTERNPQKQNQYGVTEKESWVYRSVTFVCAECSNLIEPLAHTQDWPFKHWSDIRYVKLCVYLFVARICCAHRSALIILLFLFSQFSACVFPQVLVFLVYCQRFFFSLFLLFSSWTRLRSLDKWINGRPTNFTRISQAIRAKDRNASYWTKIVKMNTINTWADWRRRTHPHAILRQTKISTTREKRNSQRWGTATQWVNAMRRWGPRIWTFRTFSTKRSSSDEIAELPRWVDMCIWRPSKSVATLRQYF